LKKKYLLESFFHEFGYNALEKDQTVGGKRLKIVVVQILKNNLALTRYRKQT
jgi:hypothetical protein